MRRQFRNNDPEENGITLKCLKETIINRILAIWNLWYWWNISQEKKKVFISAQYEISGIRLLLLYETHTWQNMCFINIISAH